MRFSSAVHAGTGRRAVLMLVLVTACGGGTSDSDPTPTPGRGVAGASLPGTASDPGAQVARRIVNAATLADAVTATRDAVTRGGVPISTFAGPVEPAVGPAAPFFILPQEAVSLAYEARQRATLSRLTLAEFASMLQDFGWVFGEEGMPGDQLMRVVAAWVRHAQQAPDDPLSFTPLFLAEMGRRQVPAVDLADSTTSPRAVRLGGLDVQLIAAALTRGLGDVGDVGATPPRPVERFEIRRGDAAMQTASYGASLTANPCGDAQEWLGQSVPGQAGEALGQVAIGVGLDEALERAGLGEKGKQNVSASLAAVATALKIVKLAQLFASGELAVTPVSDLPAHRPEPGERAEVTVVARAGIDSDDWKEYQESLASTEVAHTVKDCLGSLGLPSWGDLGDLAEEAAGWRVGWMLGRGSPQHALHQLAGNEWRAAGSQNRTVQMKRTSETSAEAPYTFKLTDEWRRGHPGEQFDAEVEVTAELHTAKPPTISTFASAAGGLIGLLQGVAELGIGWFQTVVTPESTLIVPVTYHDDGIHFLIEDEEELTVDIGDNGPSMIRGTARDSSRHVYAGTIRLGEDSLWHGQLVLTSSGTYTVTDTAAVGAVTAGLEQDGEAGLAAMKRTLAMMQNVPTCTGSYYGFQIFAVEGSYVRDRWGATKVELAIIPVADPEEFHQTKGCPREELSTIDGFATVPNRLIQAEQRSAFTIDPPRPGVRQVYPSGWNRPGNRRSTRIVINEDFR